MSRRKTTYVTCKYCGEEDLWWIKHNGGWMLRGLNGIHRCLKQPVPRNLKSTEPAAKPREYHPPYADDNETYLPAPEIPKTDEFEKQQAVEEYKSWAELQQRLNKILE